MPTEVDLRQVTSAAPRDSNSLVRQAAQRAKTAAHTLGSTSSTDKQKALERIADALEQRSDQIVRTNALDLADAERDVTRGRLSTASLQRLELNPHKVASLADQVRTVAVLEDPIGRVLERTLLDDGLLLERVSCPLGVIAAIVEARPDAVTQIAALALRSGNALLIKAGRHATRTARALVKALHEGLEADGGVPVNAVTLVEGRAAVETLLSLDGLIDLVVPRGSRALVRHVQSQTHIPVLGHADGVCHIYLDAAADLDMSIALVLDSKTQYPAACNSVEAVLVHCDAAPRLLPVLATRLKSAGVELRGCERSRRIAGADVSAAAAADWGKEYGDLILAMRVVDSLEDAVAYINRYGSHHTESIVTNDREAAASFLAHVDAAGVFHNASTRFADGYRYGLGAEIGISTGKVHARGPVGLAGLCSYKYLLHGNGQIVETYSDPNGRSFLHRRSGIDRGHPE